MLHFLPDVRFLIEEHILLSHILIRFQCSVQLEIEERIKFLFKFLFPCSKAARFLLPDALCILIFLLKMPQHLLRPRIRQ
ncbi:hypothetical protein A2454_00535 [Candidatus Peribacteria bacterium RIFOXYC2_FULL_55_14]|nr:MAG: hypothetical protein A2198_04970 [Candidatus Peribacteria bacterium RIFOXYA1_FULL_56_14]OGJ72921.1 MAG: hypothetical protein A2217_06480 [Candidatus Peribacteria bacterium RIFOXYA2_FULL_55_28]OGJ76087.1 MAG: hypothetical protein A2327_04220 [Candidatus Peribacteria bacterium RIFOXYB2_FULL_54_17]OGJ79547.1 MAG: hypothetical protein A2424_00705 [Candidatus Peribacteria bacterium RIFOXYC1_FULL_54_13]OGJ79949.1 MAG: hypothetical protein A2454_00535 [Candidatus Peribacteria bacterium RIFOXYC